MISSPPPLSFCLCTGVLQGTSTRIWNITVQPNDSLIQFTWQNTCVHIKGAISMSIFCCFFNQVQKNPFVSTLAIKVQVKPNGLSLLENNRVYARLLVTGSWSHINLSRLLYCELSPALPDLVYGNVDTMKEIKIIMKQIIAVLTPFDLTRWIEMLYRMTWSKAITVKTFAEQFEKSLSKESWVSLAFVLNNWNIQFNCRRKLNVDTRIPRCVTLLMKDHCHQQGAFKETWELIKKLTPKTQISVHRRILRGTLMSLVMKKKNWRCSQA